jgi:hypothetical protein
MGFKKELAALLNDSKNLRKDLEDIDIELDELRKTKVEIKKQIEDCLKENLIRTQQSKKANQELKLASRAKQKE